MSQRLWLAVILAIVIIADAHALNAGRVVGGAETHVTSLPYQVSIRRRSCALCYFVHFANGAIYSRNIIITTATAVLSEDIKHLMVVAGTSHRTAFDGMLFPVEKKLIHENFKSSTLDYDIALLKLKVDLPLGNSNVLQALCIARVLPKDGSLGFVGGWGKTSETGDYSELIKSVRIPTVSRESCQLVHKYSEITANMFCAGDQEGGRDACKGDAGAPFVVANEIVGLVSWGLGCSRANTPGVYTNLVQLREWVVEAANSI